jgi:hypothetical protein
MDQVERNAPRLWSPAIKSVSARKPAEILAALLKWSRWRFLRASAKPMAQGTSTTIVSTPVTSPTSSGRFIAGSSLARDVRERLLRIRGLSLPLTPTVTPISSPAGVPS